MENLLEQTLNTCLVNDYCLGTIQSLEIGEHVTYKDDDDNDVRIFRNETSFGINPIAWSGVEEIDLDGIVTLDDSYIINIETYQVPEATEADFDPITPIVGTNNDWRVGNFVKVTTNWANGTKTNHKYLDSKGITPADVAFDYRVSGGDLIWQAGSHKYQIINEQGKRFHNLYEGAETNAIVGSGIVKWVTEGFADAITINMATGDAVAIAGSDGLLVGTALKHPNSVIAGDKDPSKKIAKRAKEVGVRVIAPTASYDGASKDWDEVRQDKGLAHVTSRLDSINNTPNAYVNRLIAEGWCKKTNGQGKLIFWNKFSNMILDDNAMASRVDKASVGSTAYILSVLNKKMVHASGQTFRPDVTGDVEENGSTWVNTFKPVFTTDGVIEEDEADIFIELVKRVFPNEEDFKWGIGWLAHMVQKPEERPSIHPNIRSDHGIGKGVLIEIMGQVLNGQVKRTDLGKYLSNFSTDNTGCLLTFIDEAKSMGTKAYMTLKGLMADNSINIERKYEQTQMEKVFNRLMFSGNDKGVNIPIEENDRRFYITEYASHKVSKEDSRIFCQGALEWAECGGADSVKKYLLSLDISYWEAHDSVAANTSAKREYIDGGLVSLNRLIKDYPHKALTIELWDNFIDSEGVGDGFSYQSLLRRKDEFFESKLSSVGWSAKKRWKHENSRFTGRVLETGATGKRALELYSEATLLLREVDQLVITDEIVVTESEYSV